MSPIPWAALLTHGPTIVSAARSLLDSQSRKAHERHQDINTRLDHLEKSSVETARLLKEMAEQLQALTLAQAEMQKRLRLTLILSLAASALAVGALIYALVR